MADETVRPTKKQREILSFIETFIVEHGYSPSYREIMAGLDYTSVATVSLHVNSLIRRGHLAKRDHSARSLEVVTSINGDRNSPSSDVSTKAVTSESQDSDHRHWLYDLIEQKFTTYENMPKKDTAVFEELKVLVAALNIIGLSNDSAAFQARLDQA